MSSPTPPASPPPENKIKTPQLKIRGTGTFTSPAAAEKADTKPSTAATPTATEAK